MDRKLIYLFSEANGQMRELLGGKGANLAEMTVLGLPVPQGFTITTEACNMYYENGERLPESLERNIYDYVAKLEHITGKKFGSPENPLLVSVRSGARASMPGMMDTILNLGLNDDVVEGLDSYRCFPMWLWVFPNRVLRSSSTKSKKKTDSQTTFSSLPTI